jgi:hypothetical protein
MNNDHTNPFRNQLRTQAARWYWLWLIAGVEVVAPESNTPS